MNIQKWLTVAILALAGFGTAKAQVVVANSSVKISEISKADLHDIFIGASNAYKDGSHAVPVTLQKGPVQEKFLKDRLGMSEMQFGREWRKLIFAGQALMPRSFETEAALVEYIASVPGAIGYVGTTSDVKKVKILAVK